MKRIVITKTGQVVGTYYMTENIKKRLDDIGRLYGHNMVCIEVQCDDCGKWVRGGASSLVHDYATTYDGQHICYDCLNDHWAYCEGYGEWYPQDDVERFDVNGESGIFSYSYINCNTFECEECGERFTLDNEHYIDGESYCDVCAESAQRAGVHGYHYHKGLFKKQGKGPVYVGLEHEVNTYDADGYDDDIVADMGDAMGDYIVGFEEDGSLDEGFEMISNPISVELLPDYFERLRKAFSYATESGCRSHDSGDCGVHIHISKEAFGDTEQERDENIAKIHNFYTAHWHLLKIASRRDSTSWCNLRPTMSQKDAVNKVKGAKGYNDHNTAINLGNDATVEFRLARGTLKVDTIAAWVDLHLTLAKNSRTIKPNNINFADWTDGVNAQTFERLGIAQYL